jgi:uncharacterized repeat protein (TIGR01451 family)
MQLTTSSTRRPVTVTVLAVLAALVGMLVLQATAALGAPQTQDFTGDQAATPDIERTGLRFFLPDGSRGGGGAAGTINLTLDGVPVVSYCVQTTTFLRETGTVTSDVSEVPLATAEDRAVLWILRNQTPTGIPTPEKQAQAAAAQVAVWVLRGQLRATNPTSDAGVNEAAAALIQTALSESAAPRTLALSAGAPAPGATTATVTVKGKPGAVVALAIASGPGTLSAPSVTIGAGGTASVTLTAPGPGTTVISASTDNDGTLYRITPQDGSQGTTIAAGGRITASTSVGFTAPAAVVPVVTTTGTTTARLSLTKTAPASARVLRRVRYTITVRNTSTVIARGVVLRDRLPRGMSFAAASRRGTLSDGTLTFALGDLRAGRSRTVKVWLVANAEVRGTRVNTATASATRVRSVRARAATLFRPLARRVQPAVTG